MNSKHYYVIIRHYLQSDHNADQSLFRDVSAEMITTIGLIQNFIHKLYFLYNLFFIYYKSLKYGKIVRW